MDIEWIRKHCLSLAGATEQVQWGCDLVFKVGGKMFAVTPLEPARVWLSLKCEAEEFAELIERPGVIPAPYSGAGVLDRDREGGGAGESGGVAAAFGVL